MSTRQYIGARYVPKFADPILHNSSRSYEALEIVQNAIGDSFTSKKPVPVGIALDNTEYWVASGNFNSQLGEVKNDLIALTERVDNIPITRRIILIGDSFVQGVGGDGSFKDIEREIKSLTNFEVNSYYAGGGGYLRYNSDNKRMYEVLLDAIENEEDTDLVTDVVLAASVYNDMGLVSDPSFNETSFYNAIKEIADKAYEEFPNCKVTIIPALWCSKIYNQDFAKISVWEENSAIKLGLNFAHKPINWLQIYNDSDVTNDDNIHPKHLGYQIIGEHIACVLNGKDPGIAEIRGLLNTNTNDQIAYRVSGHNLYMDGTVSKESGQTFTNLISDTLPACFKNLSNRPIFLQKYGGQSAGSSIATIISAGVPIYLGSDNMDTGTTYIIQFCIPVVPANP